METLPDKTVNQTLDQMTMFQFSDAIKEAGNKIRELLDKVKREETPKEFQHKDYFGFDYVSLDYMTNKLDELCPNWSWIPYDIQKITGKNGDVGIIYTGILRVIMEGIVRECSGEGGSQFQFSKDTGGVLSIGDPVKIASTDAFKKACSRMLRIANDVYKQDTSIILEELYKVREQLSENNTIWFDKQMQQILNKKTPKGQDVPPIEKRNAYNELLKRIQNKLKETKNEQEQESKRSNN